MLTNVSILKLMKHYASVVFKMKGSPRASCLSRCGIHQCESRDHDHLWPDQSNHHLPELNHWCMI